MANAVDDTGKGVDVISQYSEFKEATGAVLQKVGSAYIFAVPQFHPIKGTQLDPTIIKVSKKNVTDEITDLEEKLTNAKQLLTDLEALDKA